MQIITSKLFQCMLEKCSGTGFSSAVQGQKYDVGVCVDFIMLSIYYDFYMLQLYRKVSNIMICITKLFL